MTSDDLKKIFLGPTLFRLDTILSPRLVPALYAVGMGALLLWAVTHLFSTFGRTFGDGLWGLLEIAVFGLLGIIVLRIVCEVLLVFFKANEAAARAVGLSRISRSLVEEVNNAIHDIAEDDDIQTELGDDSDDVTGGTIRRSARRSPPTTPDL